MSLEWWIALNVFSVCAYGVFFGYQWYRYRRDKPDAWLYPPKEKDPLEDLADLVKECSDES